MIKTEHNPDLQVLLLINRLATKIATKLCTLGYCKREINQKLYDIISQTLNIKGPHLRNLQRFLNQRLEKEQIDKRALDKLAVELDLYANSIHDNYESESQASFLKFQNLAEVNPSDKVDEDKVKKEVKQEYIPPEGNNGSARGELRRETMEGHRNRRLFQKLNKRKEVKLEYLNIFNY